MKVAPTAAIRVALTVSRRSRAESVPFPAYAPIASGNASESSAKGPSMKAYAICISPAQSLLRKEKTMQKVEQKRILIEALGHLQTRLLHKLSDVPENWEAVELREWFKITAKEINYTAKSEFPPERKQAFERERSLRLL